MLIDRYPREDVFARVPELADQTDPVLVQLDRLLDDDQVYQQVRTDLARRYRLTPVHGRHSTPVEVILRLLVVQHLYVWSYQETVERVADSLVLRWFCRVYFRCVPTKATLLRWAQTIRPATLHTRIERAALLAKRAKVTHARKLRIDSTCVQTPIHHPTDSGLLVDGVRVLARLVRRAKPVLTGQLVAGRDAFRSRLRTARRALQRLHRVRRLKGEDAAEQQRALYQVLLSSAQQTLRQAQRIRDTLARGEPAPDQVGTTRPVPLAHRLQSQLDGFLPLVQRVIDQAHRRVLDGQLVPAAEKVLSLFEPHTRVIPRHKGGATVEFGRQVMLDEVEGGLVTRSYVLGDGESDRHQALPAVRHHRHVFGRAPVLLAGDRGVHTKGVEADATALAVRHIVIPRSGPTTPAQRAHERDRAWRRRYRWRAGIEGRIHSLRRDYGLARCRSHGLVGLERDVGWGVLASDLRHIAAAQVRRQQAATQQAA